MNKFIKPKTVSVSDTEYIQKLVNVNLHKDLHDGEEICQYCHGTGMIIYDYCYGLIDDTDKLKGKIPYKHQALSFCPNCFNGVVHRCKYCGKLLKKGSLACDCEIYQQIKKQERNELIQNEFEIAPIAPQEVVDTMPCFFSEHFGYNNGYFFDFDEFFEYWENHHKEDENDRPLYVWVTESTKMKIDAEYIVECATEELYEDALYDISNEEIKELQNFLNDWCKRCGVGTTYHESHKYKVRIPWEIFDSQK